MNMDHFLDIAGEQVDVFDHDAPESRSNLVGCHFCTLQGVFLCYKIDSAPCMQGQ